MKDGSKPYGAGTYVVTVTGIGSYKDSFTKEFVIEKANLANETEVFSAKVGEERTECIYKEDIAELTLGAIAVSDSDGILDETPELITTSESVSLKFKFKADAETGKTATVTISVTDPNYVWNLVITLTVEDSGSAPVEKYTVTAYGLYGETMGITPGTTYDAASVLVNGRTMVPIRIITESFGGKVTWNEAAKEVILTIDGNVIRMTVGKTFAAYGVAPMIQNGRTYVPVRFVADQLGASIDWKDTTKTVIITKK